VELHGGEYTDWQAAMKQTESVRLLEKRADTYIASIHNGDRVICALPRHAKEECLSLISCLGLAACALGAGEYPLRDCGIGGEFVLLELQLRALMASNDLNEHGNDR
jgi:hypothetical protein